MAVCWPIAVRPGSKAVKETDQMERAWLTEGQQRGTSDWNNELNKLSAKRDS